MSQIACCCVVADRCSMHRGEQGCGGIHTQEFHTMPHNPPKRDSFADVSFPKSSQLLRGPFFCGGSVTRLQLQAPNTSQSWTIRIMKNMRMLSSHGGAQLFGQKISSSTVSNAKTSRVVRLLTEERESGLLRSCALSDRGIKICPPVRRFHVL